MDRIRRVLTALKDILLIDHIALVSETNQSFIVEHSLNQSFPIKMEEIFSSLDNLNDCLKNNTPKDTYHLEYGFKYLIHELNQKNYYLILIFTSKDLDWKIFSRNFLALFDLIECEVIDYVDSKLSLQQLSSKEIFLANISHEIRTPMNGILGMVNCLKETTLSKQQKEMLRVISSCGDSLLTILNDVLDYTKIKSGNLELEQIPFNLKEVLFDSLSLFVGKAKEKNNLVKLEISPQMNLHYLGDPNRLKQIINNLLSNAIKFTTAGKIILKAESELGEFNLKISVIDSGIGISKMGINKIFDTFKQEDSSISRKYGGTGLGLSICRQLTEAMKGKISVDSVEGQGTTFTVHLPLPLVEQTSAENPSVVQDNKINSVNQKNYPHNILVVEDNRINQRIACSLLEKLGYSPDKANNGREAIEMAKTKNYSLIFMDMQMPEVDGLEATKRILNEQGETHPTIIAITANIFEEDKRNCFEAGMSGFINKPFKITDFKKAILSIP